MKYYYAETTAEAAVNNDNLWSPLTAGSLAAAQRQAARLQLFQGTALHIAIKIGDEFERVAVKRPDAINRNNRGRWVEIEKIKD